VLLFLLKQETGPFPNETRVVEAKIPSRDAVNVYFFDLLEDTYMGHMPATEALETLTSMNEMEAIAWVAR